MMVKLLRLAVVVCVAIASPCRAFQTTTTNLNVPNPPAIRRLSPARPIHENSLLRRSAPIRATATTTTSLQAAPFALLGAAGSPAGAFLVLTGIVLIHESGHYLAARNYGVKVDEFAIGFGPKLFGFEALGNEFNFRAFPLGGYVRFPENYNMTLVNEQQQQLREEYREWRELTSGTEEDAVKPKSAGYQVANLLTLGAMEQQRKQKEEEALLKEQEAKQNQPWWKSIFSAQPQKPKIPPKPINPDDIEIDYYDDPDLLQNRPWPERAVVLSGGVAFNLLLAFVIYFAQITTTGLPQPVFDQGIKVSQNPIEQGAANGILRKGDVVVGVNGKLQRSWGASGRHGEPVFVFVVVLFS